MRIANCGSQLFSLSAAALLAVVALALHLPALGAGDTVKVDPRKHLSELARLGARKPFLTDSPDVYLDPRSLNRFFTVTIYRRLQGNAYFGYDFDEGFIFEGQAVQIEVLKDLTPGAGCRSRNLPRDLPAAAVVAVATSSYADMRMSRE